jgi:FixJ family two-component response regulator
VTDRVFAIVVDDDPSVRRALRRLLLSAGMDVETYGSGAGFMEAALDREPDCVILDIRMPGMSGPELHDRILAMGRRIPVVFITAHAEDEDGLASRGTEVLRKPFGDLALLDAIHRSIQKRSAG